MSPPRPVVAAVFGAAVVIALTVAGCGGAPVDPALTDGTAADQAAVETVFHSYHQALLARDFATACALNAAETSAELVRNVAAQGGPAGTCEQALTTVYTPPDAAAMADRVSTSAQVRQVHVIGDTATVSWTFDNQGHPEPVDTGLRRIDGQWRLLDVGA